MVIAEDPTGAAICYDPETGEAWFWPWGGPKVSFVAEAPDEFLAMLYPEGD
jgi:hypothetical protein